MLSRNLQSTYKAISKGVFRNFACLASPKVTVSPGHSTVQTNNDEVDLRGVHIKGKYEDLPTLIWFPQLLDPAENWIKFFTNPDNRILEYRNVWLLNPRNFGGSDRHASFYGEDLADDVVRFMWKHKLSTASIGGHGIGGKIALAAACYHSDRFSGYFGLDYTPVNYAEYEAFKEIVTYLNALRGLNLKRNKAHINHDIDQHIGDAKWAEIFKQNLKMLGKGNYEWNFDFDALLENVNNSTANNIGAWHSHYGLWGGRANFAFGDYSRWVHIGSNTLPMHKICPKIQGHGRDIFALPSDENPANHWIYEHSELSDVAAMRMTEFFNLYDGVHVLMADRLGLTHDLIPDRPKTRNSDDFVPSQYIPAHHHHNWRYKTQE